MTAKNTARFPVKKALAAALLVLLAAALVLVYAVFGAKPVAGSKAITISVVNSKAETTTYSLKTDAQYLRVYVRQLRQKIEGDAERPQYVLTETGIGYRLRAPD